ncbi:uncharacterized protein LAESUDRAFT_638789 [Laetiporus sulphureus 93-53]|uniref:RNA polymerase II assembly factor Rtp1 C-terminal domain-containing protein n=1 Tax=Laetiporus sulphureus 93-53 TaxID=1314785 RepID=A0A165I503_9APHY|nr:uncharacterized protein LAESUDRAFT_638789 [Laetiporus sulphureus 93-53]KZT12600.1 hypothetical protein LAESUDRAFT_638789 [Laetiporus sulphureus 93-53]
MEIAQLLRAGASLIGSSPSEATSDIREVLQRRLTRYYSTIGKDDYNTDGPLEDLQLKTASEALNVAERVHIAWKRDALSAVSEAQQQPNVPGAAIGTRDLAQIHTLLSIVFKWSLEPMLAHVVNAIPAKSVSHAHVHGGAKIIDLTGVPSDYAQLSAFTSRLLRLVLPDSQRSQALHTVISSTLLNRHLTDLLRPCMVLGWLPRNLATESVRPVDEIRPLVMQLLSSLPASQTIAALGAILSDDSVTLPYVRKCCGFLLSRQLLRPEGIYGLLTTMFGEEDISGEDAPLEKLEHVGRLLATSPASMKPEDYYAMIVPRLVAILSADPTKVPPAHRRAVAFSLSRMLASDDTENQDVVTAVLLPILHRPFLQIPETAPPLVEQSDSSKTNQKMLPSAALLILQTLLTNADPSPTFITTLLTPIVPPLFAILSHLEATRTSDPALKESVRGFLVTWGRVVGTPEGIEALWRIVLDEGGEWKTDVAGNLSRIEVAENAPALSLFTPENLRRAEDAGELDVDANVFGLSPDPARFVRFLKAIERSDISSELFVRLLEAYRESKADMEADPLQTLLFLQLILQMQHQLVDEKSTSNVLNKPDHILSFIKHALESTEKAAPEPTRKQQEPRKEGLRMEDLRIVEDQEEELEEGDSDDEVAEETAGGTSDDEMTVTAINLLLSIMEVHPDLSARTAPILNDIFSLLEPLSKTSAETIRPLAREARMVMTARLASTSAPPPKSMSKTLEDDEESPAETYQKALKLLQDPLLPVRAHGLLLLRQLVSLRKRTTADGKLILEEPVIDSALVPAILSIFLQSVQDDDSYMFLNAVQGLSAMVDGFGKEVLRGLVGTYSEGMEGLGGTAMTQHDVDVRTRVGEALGQVIRRCGDALPAYVNILVPPLFRVVRTSHFPTTLRTSAISLLAQCAKTNSLALLPYAADLSEAMVDLLQVETVSAAERSKKNQEEKPKADMPVSEEAKEQARAPDKGDKIEELEAPVPATMDAQPTSTNSRFPPLRRAALHFLSLLIQACISRVYEYGDGDQLAFPPHLVKRAKNTLGYVAATDDDAVVRVMAREALEGLDQLAEAALGF